MQDALALVEKNTLGLQTNCSSVAEEVDEIYRRLSKALKDRTEHLRNEVDRYLSTELRGLIQLKENLELEIANIQSNCDLAEAHINENVPWDDSELLDTKELFLRTVEFIRFVTHNLPLFFFIGYQGDRNLRLLNLTNARLCFNRVCETFNRGMEILPIVENLICILQDRL